ncbi:PVC-type heme-binding CxxCH protein [Parapedobacter indicus]|uniref:Putative membrane-bound dehydrogenase domain-containing protein n=1 Tax=Parapedobacter indicus TaxID=1477437 RepID=A0A1I3FKP7_9SPHI|nr:PVC-type heme-binding CxxCH protein [Parapedobacter indicus]PPL03768.1 putative membrane-bound dehydrogenase-like protein [Parapedobacter indicus]SFI11727.1 putative membrane-bound dehydrogenase domain-containing protein [Parapedobacter indicus]
MFFRQLILRASFLSFIAILSSCADSEPEVVYKLNPQPNNSIVIIGNTFAERLQYYNYLEPLLYKSFPDKNITVRNLGWSADEINMQSRPLNFPTQDELMTAYKADLILACYGLNEAFKGPDSLGVFKAQLTTYLQHLQQQQFNGKTPPQVVLVSPIAHEKMGGFLPDPAEHNKNLALYTDGMQQVAKELDIPFINLFETTKKLQKGKDKITINGIHLNEAGYKAVGEIIAKSLALPVAVWQESDQHLQNLKKIIDKKNQQFFYLYRAVNSEYIVGRREEPWVQPPGGPISYPKEFAKLGNMVLRLDSIVWKQSVVDDLANFVQSDHILNDTIQFEPLDKANLKKPSTDQFILPEGFEINLFASEVDFSLTNPVTITFDPQGRMWIADMPSYPQYLPGVQPNDKILILEDTDGDGVADSETIYADSLYMPMGMELGNGGIYVSQPPNLWFMRDTDGDGKADEKEIILHGFGTEDVHHTLDTHTWGPDGALYWHTGTFLHSQIETPWGPQRSDYGATWRFEPLTNKLEPYVSYPYANPWGHVFLRDGTEIISDVSTGMNYFAPPLTVATDYPVKHTTMRDFLTSMSKPKTCGTEIISSRHFPEELQGNVLFNTFVGTMGTKQHRINESGSGIVAQEIEPLLQSTDPNFRPVDLQFGPDGALYIVDWYNPIINHGERALRDPLRDHTHGRIWRITYKNREPLKPVNLTKLPIDKLLDQLKEYEDRVRYRVRTQLRQLDAEVVLPALNQWIAGLDRRDSLYDQHRLEGLWVYQQFNQLNQRLLEELLNSRHDDIRTAATRVLFFWRNRIKEAENKLIDLSKDSSMKVRLQAIISLSHFKTERSVVALLDAATMPTDYYIDYALKESFRYLKPVWWSMLKKDNDYLADQPAKAAWLLGSLADEKELAVPGFIVDDPQWPKYGWRALTDKDYDELKDNFAVASFRKDQLAAAEAAKTDNRTPEERGKMLIADSDCVACHQEHEKLVGPAYARIAQKYGDKDIPKLVDKIIEGGSGVWGDMAMTPHPGLKQADAEAIVRYILSVE